MERRAFRAGLFAAALFAAALGSFGARASTAPAGGTAPVGSAAWVEACLAAGKNRNWTPPEKRAWDQICRDHWVQLGRDRDPQTLRNQDYQLGGGFMQQIYGDPQLASFTSAIQIQFDYVDFDYVLLDKAAIKGLIITNSIIEHSVGITDSKIEDAFVISYCSVGVDFAMLSDTGGAVSLDHTRVPELKVLDSNLRELWLEDVDIDSLAFDHANSSDETRVTHARVTEFAASYGEVASIKVQLDRAQSVALSNYQVKGDLALDLSKNSWLGNWTPLSRSFSSLTIENLSARRWLFSGPLPPHVSISRVSFEDADWGSDPVPLLQSFDKLNHGYMANLYPVLAKAYGDRGYFDTAHDILFEGENARLAQEKSWWGIAYLWMSWALVGYGYHPEIGFLWILGFVLLGTAIFWTGSHRLAPGVAAPRSWLTFSLDAVLPGIHLDEAHGKIAFAGWRQYFLYFLRFLGAVVVVLILTLLKRSVDSI